MSAHLNTVSGTIYEDFVVKMLGIKVSDLTASIIMKCTVVITGVMCVMLVFVVEQMKGILQVRFPIVGKRVKIIYTSFKVSNFTRWP